MLVVMGCPPLGKMTLAKSIGFTHSIEDACLGEAAHDRLLALRDEGWQVVFRPEHRCADTILKDQWMENHMGRKAPSERRRECNNFPDPFHPETMKMVWEPVQDTYEFCIKNNVPIAGVYVGIAAELGMPRQFLVPVDRADYLWAYSPYMKKEYKRLFGHSPSRTLSDDTKIHGSQTIHWLHTLLVDWINNASKQFEPNLQPWIPVIGPGWEHVSFESCTKLLLEYIHMNVSNPILLSISLYDAKQGHSSSSSLAHTACRNHLYKWINLVGAEAVPGILAGNAARAKRDGYSGLVAGVLGLTDRNVSQVGELVAHFGGV